MITREMKEVKYGILLKDIITGCMLAGETVHFVGTAETDVNLKTVKKSLRLDEVLETMDYHLEVVDGIVVELTQRGRSRNVGEDESDYSALQEIMKYGEVSRA